MNPRQIEKTEAARSRLQMLDEKSHELRQARNAQSKRLESAKHALADAVLNGTFDLASESAVLGRWMGDLALLDLAIEGLSERRKDLLSDLILTGKDEVSVEDGAHGR